MEKSGFVVEVLGIPEGFPDQMIVDQLRGYFLRFRISGGLDLRVLYPCYRPDQAFVIFQEKEAGVRVLQNNTHVLDFAHRRHHLRVKEADRPEVDLKAEATLRLNEFRDKKEVRKIVRSHGFVMRDLNQDQVHITGSFTKLRELKSHLEQLHKSQNQTKTAPGLRHPPVSSGAVPKRYTNHHLVSDDRTWDSPSSQPTRSSLKKSRSVHYDSPLGSHSFLFDSDVLQYAQHFRKKDVDGILTSHDVSLKVDEDNTGISNITLLGKEADKAAEELKELLNHLGKSLRTQEISLKDLDRGSKAALAKRIREENRSLVLIFQLLHEVRIVGTSNESFEVKQRLLDSCTKKRKEKRSFSLDRFLERRPAARAQVSAAGAPGYSGSKQQNDQSVEPKRATRWYQSFRKKSSESKVKDQAKKAEDIKPEKEKKQPSKFKSFVELFKRKK